MKQIILILITLFTVFTSVEAAKLKKNDIVRIWNVTKVETTDQTLNFMTQDIDFSKLLVEFTKSGTVSILGKDTKTKYTIKGDKIILSEGLIKEPKSEIKASIQSENLLLNISADLVKQILLIIKDQYTKSGGDAFIAKMIENAAKTYSIEAVITLKRK
jgi:hypothetical protein